MEFSISFIVQDYLFTVHDPPMMFLEIVLKKDSTRWVLSYNTIMGNKVISWFV